MKGRNSFTQVEFDRIKDLVARRERAVRDEQKKIRRALRRMGFHIRDFISHQRGIKVRELQELVTTGHR